MSDPTVTDGGNVRRRGRRALAALVGFLLFVAGVTAGTASRSIAVPSMPSDTSAEAGFARVMQTHHAQAVDMAMTIRDRTSDRDIRTLAYDIALTQQEQIGQMHGWLTQWDLPQTGTRPAMAWMADHQHDTATTAVMPGMATRAQLRRLRHLNGRQAEVLFLTLMIRHHRAGITMAGAAVARASRPEVQRLATTMVTGQRREIDQMQDLLRRRDAPPA